MQCLWYVTLNTIINYSDMLFDIVMENVQENTAIPMNLQKYKKLFSNHKKILRDERIWKNVMRWDRKHWPWRLVKSTQVKDATTEIFFSFSSLPFQYHQIAWTISADILTLKKSKQKLLKFLYSNHIYWKLWATLV